MVKPVSLRKASTEITWCCVTSLYQELLAGQKMAPTELDHLKSLVAQLEEKIKAIEFKASQSKPVTPAQQLRTILVGPPGAGWL